MHLQVSGMDELMRKLEKLADQSKVEAIARKAVDAALPALEGSVRSHIHPRDVAGGVTRINAEVNTYGVFGVVTVTGRNRKGELNVKRANILEYGTHDGRTPAKPWRAASAGAVEATCKETMETIVESEMGCE